MGAVLGSKKLKAIIIKGSNIKLEVANPDKFKEANKNARDNVKSSFATQVLASLGTSGALDMHYC